MNPSETEIAAQTTLPLIRLSLAKPIVEEVERRGVAIHKLLDDLSLSRDAIFTQELFVPAPVMYSLLEGLAWAAKDPHLTVAIGEQLDLTEWPVFTEAAANSTLIGDFFNRFIIGARAHATSIRYLLTIDGIHAWFKAQRSFKPDTVPAQADAFYAGLIVNIFRHAVGLDWDPGQVTATVSDLGAVPRRYRGMHLQQGDKSGASLRFPTSWLLLPFAQEPTGQQPTGDFYPPPRDLIEAIRESLKPYLHLSSLSVSEAAEICGFKDRVLRSKLQKKNTSLGREIAWLREQKAIQLLVTTGMGIADIGVAVGFQDPASFSRAFKAWTGMSPKKYRQIHSGGLASRAVRSDQAN